MSKKKGTIKNKRLIQSKHKISSVDIVLVEQINHKSRRLALRLAIGIKSKPTNDYLLLFRPK